MNMSKFRSILKTLLTLKMFSVVYKEVYAMMIIRIEITFRKVSITVVVINVRDKMQLFQKKNR